MRHFSKNFKKPNIYIWCYLKTHKTELSFREGIWFQAQGWSWVPRKMKCPLLSMQELLGVAHRTHSPSRLTKQGRNLHSLPQEEEPCLSPSALPALPTSTQEHLLAVFLFQRAIYLLDFTLTHSCNSLSQEEWGKFITKRHFVGLLGRQKNKGWREPFPHEFTRPL